MPNRTSGAFITLEGIDGSGKSTQADVLAQALATRGLPVRRTREPGGSTGAEEIRRLLVEGDPARWSAQTEILLFTAARRDHLERVIQPEIAAGTNVVCDRFADSTRVYQGAARADLRDLVDRLHDLVIGVEPDLTLVIDMDPETALQRGLARQSGEDRFEDFGLEFQNRLRTGFQDLVKQYPQRCHLIDGNRAEPMVARDIMDHVDRFLDG